MPHRRPVRLADQIRQEVSDIIRTEMKDPRIGFITVTAVDISIDLRHAKVFFSVLGSESEQRRTLDSLQKAAGFIRSQLGRRIRIRHIPELLFRYDDSFEYAQHIAEVMKQIEPVQAEHAASEQQMPSTTEEP